MKQYASSGYHVTPSGDRDVDGLVIDVTGTPTIGWDESEDKWISNKGFNITGGLTASGVVSLADGSAAAPSLTNTGDLNTGVFFPADDAVGIAGQGVEILRATGGASIAATVLSSLGTKEATSTTVGSAVFAGGVGVAKELRVGGAIRASSGIAVTGNQITIANETNPFFSTTDTTAGGAQTMLRSIGGNGFVGTQSNHPFRIMVNTNANVAVIFETDLTAKFEATIKLKERAAALGDTAGYGQLWVKTATPNELWFTDDAGTDTQIV